MLQVLKVGKNRYTLSSEGNTVSQMKVEREESIKNLYFIYDVETNPSHRHKGYAYTLLKRVLRYLRSRNTNAIFYLAVAVDNSPAIHLYERLGFSKCVKFSEDGRSYYCMTTGKGWIVTRIADMYKHSYTDAIDV